MYKAIARRFRPKTFSDVTGQGSIVTTLKHAILQKKASHAYLFCGIRGTGKTTLARLFAKALNCAHPTPDGEPCNECDSCKEISEGRSLDVIEIDGASNRGIDDIRSINDTLGYATVQNRFKIYLIDEVHMLTKEAFNALLKSLEEPPKQVKFFLATTEPQKVLPTIISRCQRFDLARIKPSEMIKKLRSIAKELDIAIEDEALGVIARLSDGSLRDAESLFDQIACQGVRPITSALVSESIGLVAKEHFFALDEAYQQGNVAFAFELSQELFVKGKEISFLLENLLEHYRNIALLLLKKQSAETTFWDEEEREGYKRAVTIYDLPIVLYIIDYLTDLYTSTNKTTFKKIHLEMMLLRIIQSKNRITIEQIIAQLHGLENKPLATPAPVVSTPIQPTPVQPTHIQSMPVEAPATEETPSQDHTEAARLETLMRFAQVELGGNLKKNL